MVKLLLPHRILEQVYTISFYFIIRVIPLVPLNGHTLFFVPFMILLLNCQIHLRCLQSGKARGTRLSTGNFGLPIGKANEVDRTDRQDVLQMRPG